MGGTAKIPSKTWRECIKKIWEVDPLICPRCGGMMKIISFITEYQVIKQILEHIGLWQEKTERSPPAAQDVEVSYEAHYEDYPVYEEPAIMVN